MRWVRAISWVACVGGVLSVVASAQTTTRVSVSSASVEGNGLSSGSSISADGRSVAFRSSASNLVPGDTNNDWDIFVRDVRSGTTTRVSVSSTGAQANAGTFWAQISADGRFVAFSTSEAFVAGDTNGSDDVYVHDMQTGTTTRASVGTGGTQGNQWSLVPSISGDGRFVAFLSRASNLVAGDTNMKDDVFVHDRVLGVTTRVDVASNGVQANGHSSETDISADGRYVVFSSYATNLDPADTDNFSDVYIHDRQSGTTELVSISMTGTGSGSDCYPSGVSADGRFVAFDSASGAVVPGDTNLAFDVFVRDRLNDTTTRVSVSTAGGQACCNSSGGNISSDGRWIAFVSAAGDLIPGDSSQIPDVYVHDRITGITLLAGYSSAGFQANGSASTSISADGRFISFDSEDSALDHGDSGSWRDVFVRDRGDSVAISAFCFGDGIDGQVTTPCPCANFGDPGHGCGSSVATSGALLSATGVQPDDVQLTVADMPPGVTSIYLQGNSINPAGVVFGDGLRCASGELTRLGARTDSDLDGSTTLGPASGDVQILISGHVLAGNTYAYQTYYRTPDPSWCPPATFNVSQAIAITW